MKLSRDGAPGFAGFLVKLVGDYGELDEELEGDNAEGVLVGGFEDDGAGGSGLLDLQPAGGADAPSVAGLEAGKAVLRHRSDEIVAEALGGGEEVGRDDAADGVDTQVLLAGLAASGSVEAGHGVAAAGGEGLAEDILCGGFLWLDGRHEVGFPSLVSSVSHLREWPMDAWLWEHGRGERSSSSAGGR